MWIKLPGGKRINLDNVLYVQPTNEGRWVGQVVFNNNGDGRLYLCAEDHDVLIEHLDRLAAIEAPDPPFQLVERTGPHCTECCGT